MKYVFQDTEIKNFFLKKRSFFPNFKIKIIINQISKLLTQFNNFLLKTHQ